jgi:hypothetical protein
MVDAHCGFCDESGVGCEWAKKDKPEFKDMPPVGTPGFDEEVDRQEDAADKPDAVKDAVRLCDFLDAVLGDIKARVDAKGGFNG